MRQKTYFTNAEIKMGEWWSYLLGVILFLVASSQIAQGRALTAAGGMQVIEEEGHVVLSNGIVNLTLSVPDGAMSEISYQDSGNLLSTHYKDEQRGRWNLVWNKGGKSGDEEGILDSLPGTTYKVVEQTEDKVEVSFTTTWATGSPNVPLNVDKRFVMLKESHGFYTYAIFERLAGWPAFSIQEGRVALKLSEQKFDYMAVSDLKQRFMPKYVDRETGQPLAFKESVLLTNPTNPIFKGEVDDKYMYAVDNKDSKVHGWVATNATTPVGLWMITPSNEFRTGGPLKQDLTSHVGPNVLSMLISRHYAGPDIDMVFEASEAWKKVYGPLFIYLNTDATAKTDPSVLWKDAKERMEKEVESWPYNFPLSPDYVKAAGRGGVTGQLLVLDTVVNKEAQPAAEGFVGLAPVGGPGSWQLESKGYQFWVQTDKTGNFEIKNVLPGTYSLFAWAIGTVGQYKHATDVTIAAGASEKLGPVTFEAPRSGPTLWEIGTPDRTAAEFFAPDPSPKYKITKCGTYHDKFKQYGLWDRYEDLFPKEDLVFTMGTSDAAKDWFYTQNSRQLADGTVGPTTWKIKFNIKTLATEGNYTLQMALASDAYAKIEVRFNDPDTARPLFLTPIDGRDNAAARYGVHGLYYFFSIGVPAKLLVAGDNTIFLKQTSKTRFSEVMYDYLRFEGPLTAAA